LQKTLSFIFFKSFHEHKNSDQFGCLPGNSTTLALLKIMPDFLMFLNGKTSFLEFCLLVPSTAFDSVGNNASANKFEESGFLNYVAIWSYELLSAYKQQGKICKSIVSIL
jgi:hypothetical protein